MINDKTPCGYIGTIAIKYGDIELQPNLTTPDALFLFEWPSKGGDEIPKADLIIDIQKSDDELTRFVTLTSESEFLPQTLQEQLNGA